MRVCGYSVARERRRRHAAAAMQDVPREPSRRFRVLLVARLVGIVAFASVATAVVLYRVQRTLHAQHVAPDMPMSDAVVRESVVAIVRMFALFALLALVFVVRMMREAARRGDETATTHASLAAWWLAHLRSPDYEKRFAHCLARVTSVFFWSYNAIFVGAVLLPYDFLLDYVHPLVCVAGAAAMARVRLD